MNVFWSDNCVALLCKLSVFYSSEVGSIELAKSDYCLEKIPKEHKNGQKVIEIDHGLFNQTIVWTLGL